MEFRFRFHSPKVYKLDTWPGETLSLNDLSVFVNIQAFIMQL
jgi:hypothetical protein